MAATPLIIDIPKSKLSEAYMTKPLINDTHHKTEPEVQPDEQPEIHLSIEHKPDNRLYNALQSIINDITKQNKIDLARHKQDLLEPNDSYSVYTHTHVPSLHP